MASPYDGVPEDEWLATTNDLIAAHPLDPDEIVDVVLSQWGSIFESTIGRHGLRVGQHIRPIPQVMGNFLHELIPFEFQKRYPGEWARDVTNDQKDLVYVSDDSLSCEIKTSSDKRGIFGNRSYAQPPIPGVTGKKSKNGYFITANFEKWAEVPEGAIPRIRIVRFGWLDHTDWKPQAAASGQAASIAKGAYGTKLVELYRLKA